MASRLTASIIGRRASHHHHHQLKLIGLQLQLQLKTSPGSTAMAMATTTKRCMATFKPSIYHCEKITMKVPTMGDSITEGTIVEWAAEVGQAVKEGDVVALVETDKVTIDIKAEVDGIVSQHFGQVEETVEVGANLYEIDTEGSATVSASVGGEGEAESVSTATAQAEGLAASTSVVEESATATSSSSTTTATRQPSIQFLGKEGWKEKLSIVGESKVASTPAMDAMKPNGSITLDGKPLTPMYGRLPFSEREMEALILGGASEAPAMKE
mmetsp:Transcript_3157/g.3834  ORF Transcript_3157/g.3834 Transcript_3157/m.3834 type:complete len:270 (-) Transcript_3157:662-1471(-)|eukprot:CAMPEP_0203695264 /NCGR_PEP_ID=MMETSP0091-20130426/6763_1 /ASSEMBLY_ACC=CAM_ASM_001089 /TAXON_ID=426623 /ORGANISM="Chaetoceros affinis, Strain CCMP159" /LENGTH=269 /DNA_ID=CAMNT_0050566775 /DNA_START=159 /DNA_END=968 /DNA_ORIENTATION=+